MPVQTPNLEYQCRKADWEKLRTFAEGARAVRACGATYLPKPSGWTDAEYDAYRVRAEVYGAVDRTVDGFDGAIFRKPPKVTVPESAEDLANDVTLSGKTLTEWIRTLVREVLTVGRGGVLVDFTSQPAQQANTTVRAPAGAPDRPYVVNYKAEQIINWDVEILNGAPRLVLVVLEECEAVPVPGDPFIKTTRKRYRVLRLHQGQYAVELWTEKEKAQAGAPGTEHHQAPQAVQYEKTSETRPTRREAPLTEIPFFFLGVTGQSVSPEKPPLLDIVDLCVLHYQTSADYAHGLHWVALPTPYICGSDDKDKIAIGPSAAIILSDPQAKVGMLEFTGAGLTAVKDRLEGLERKMAALGARILEEQKTQAESGEALKLRQSGDASVLAGISDAISRGVEAIVSRMLWWAEGHGEAKADIKVELNMDFFPPGMEPAVLLALIQARQSGEISRETFLYNLQRGEMLQEGITIEDEMAKIDSEPPPRLGSGAPGGPAE